MIRILRFYVVAIKRARKHSNLSAHTPVVRIAYIRTRTVCSSMTQASSQNAAGKVRSTQQACEKPLETISQKMAPILSITYLLNKLP